MTRFLKYVDFLLLVIAPFWGIGQITTNPELPIVNQSVTITFNSAEESRLGSFTGDLYVHTGVSIEDSGDWKNVIGTWGDNATQPKLVNLGNGIYEFTITPDINSYYKVSSTEVVTKMSFVFRSSNGSQQTNDLFVTVYQPGLNVGIDFPENKSILELNTNYTLTATASESASILFSVNNNVIATATGTKLAKTYKFTQSGSYRLIAKAEINGLIAADTVDILVREPTISATMPSGSRKGISYPNDQSVRLVLWAPEKSYVFLLFDLNNWIPDNNYQLKKDGNYFWIELSGLENGKEYPFQYYIDGKIKIADPYTEKTCDPWNDSYINENTYPGLISYPDHKTEGITSIFQPGQEAYEWQHPIVAIPEKNKQVIYELLVRDFTEEHSYAAVREKLDYLDNLNINVLELMPVNEFEGNSSWGYNPSFYFAPDKYYGSKNELKQLIDECHGRGIAVVIDMVLNHSYGQSPFVQMYWNSGQNRPSGTNPWYNETSNFQNPDAQWGYDFNHDSEATRELVDSINSFWLNEYNVDGFRFDFTKGFSNTVYGASSWGSTYDASRISNLKRMADEIWKRKPGVLVICEHLADNSEEIVLANYGLMLWGNMNKNYGEAAMGYTESAKSDLSWGYFGQSGWSEPNLVTYQESHDEERNAYRCITWGNSSGSYSIKNLDTALDRLKLNALFHISLPGPKMIWQFGELGYDVSIDYNGRIGEKPVRWGYVDRANRANLFKVYAALNMLKQKYEEFSSTDISYSLRNNVKTYQLSDGNNQVVAVGNFDVIAQTIAVQFPNTGTWYNYFGQSLYEVTNQSMNITLSAGEYLLLSTREFMQPEFTISLDNEEFTDQLFQFYPNPVADRLTIKGKNIQFVEILTLNGKVLFKQQNSENNDYMNLNINSLLPGFYFLKVHLPHSFRVSKFIKSK